MIHTRHIQKTLDKLRRLEGIYWPYIFEKVDELEVRFWETDEHLYQVPTENEAWIPAASGQEWGKAWGSAWFKGSYSIPDRLAGKNIYIRAETDGVESFFWVDGKPSGIFTHVKEADNRGNHHTLLLTASAEAGRGYELAFEAYAGHPCFGTQPLQTYESNDGYHYRFDRVYRSIDVMLCREDVQAFVFDLRTLNQLANAPAVDEFRRGQLVQELLKVFEIVLQSPEDATEAQWRPLLKEARAIMAPLLDKRGGESGPIAGIIGHSHMDTAWLWTRDETIRKCARTYANALSLMEQYPEYTFIQSSAFHAELMRRHYPDIFEGMKRRIAEGRWEPNGGVWVESDCNLVSGETLVRQFIKGQRYTREHFGYTADTFWLPDTFGYSAAIPQIMAGVGIRYFLTTKLSWNDTNSFPYDTFRWRGLDGTEVLTHFNFIHCWPDAESLIQRIYGSAYGSNGASVQNDQRSRPRNNKRLVSYGFGDGGGGPQYEMLEMARRVEDLEGVPRAAHTTVSRFMQEMEASFIDPPVHAGELYFEGHRGTLTQMHQIKRNNRKAEFALRDLELAEVWNRLSSGIWDERMAARREQYYETLLINQFHDILPGTSIPEVHDRAVQEVGEVIAGAAESTAALLSETNHESRADTITVWNTLGWQRDETIAVEGVPEGLVPADSEVVSQRIVDGSGRTKLLLAGVGCPAMGAKRVRLENGARSAAGTMSAAGTRSTTGTVSVPSAMSATGTRSAVGTMSAASPFVIGDESIETPYARVVFDNDGYIASFVDKKSGRELRRPGGNPLNALLMGEDLPWAWDNWDIDRDVFGKLQLQTGLQSREVVANGPLQLRIRAAYSIGHSSSVRQDIVFHSNTPRVDFETVIDWQEKHQLLKVGFDVDVLADRARHEVQFGHVERPTHTNTSYDQGMFEGCAHKWTDLSENRFGVALLNDCKYGVSVFGSDIRLTLHKGGTHPDPRGDQGIHEVTYAFLPHEGGFTAESVIRPAYELNVPLTAAFGSAGIEAPSLAAVDATNVIIEAIKPAEDDDAFVLRLYEAERSGVRGAKLKLGLVSSKVAVTNLLEEEIQVLLPDDSGAYALDFKPFEIKTVKVYF
ncbi:alpha-mannosidase [Paenibacillus rhizovicinus]|uniref:Alpha-mannosidase n=1 Tax=Paenibacillus rhizovicinus TaxID=2704463 RepID=A0A6C0P3E0_9BACL|nr:glycoside hydrolase family 38 C-terminal domain-containing protein [Paenibacillus rhizovicinus]QHW31182.1 alpha-mannosidase [Paenibacillus rhizovicinus]